MHHTSGNKGDIPRCYRPGIAASYSLDGIDEVIDIDFAVIVVIGTADQFVLLKSDVPVFSEALRR